MTKLQINWQARATPLVAHIAAAYDRSAQQLAKRLLDYDPALLARMNGIAGKSFIVIESETEHLPWIDGIQYFGKDPHAPNLYLPTQIKPDCPASLLERICLKLFSAPPLILVPESKQVISLQLMKPVNKTCVHKWLEGKL